MPNLYGRGVRLDIMAKDKTGKFFDIEIQRANKGAGKKRARLNSSLIDSQALKSGEESDSLPETYVIFITEHDVLQGGLGIYHIDRMIRETKKAFEDGEHILFVNNSYRESNAIGDLMHDFACKNADEMKSGLLAQRVRALKENEQEVAKMSNAIERYANERKSKWISQGIAKGRAEGKAEGRTETAADLLAIGKMTDAEIAVFFNFTPKQMETVMDIYRKKIVAE